MSQPAKAQEPSMEEILASIRRIIADDDSAKPAKAAPPPPPAPPPRPAAMPPRHPVPPSPQPAPHPAAAPQAAMNQHDIDDMLSRLDAPPGNAAPEHGSEDILDLTEQMAAPAEEEPPSFQTIDGQSDVVFTDAPPQPEALPPPTYRTAEETRRPPAAEFAPPPPPPLMSSHATAAVDSAFNTLAHTVLVQNARTLEDLVREMLRPLLKSWLDDNLPGMVERIVKAEIERVSRGR
jgi:cell pole-organizing protein PopZ